MAIKHTKVSAVPDGDDSTQIQPSDWNADHVINSYDVATTATTTNIDCSIAQIHRIDATAPITLTISNLPDGPARGTTIPLSITGNASITWPASIVWDKGVIPTLGDSWTTITLLWDGVRLMGGKGYSA